MNRNEVNLVSANEELRGLAANLRRERDRVRNENVKLREVVAQAVVLYEQLRHDAEMEGDIRAENFWLGHRETAQHALGTVPLADALAYDAVTNASKSVSGDVPSTSPTGATEK